MIEQQILQALQGIPEDKLAESYDLIYDCKVGLNQGSLETARQVC